MDDKVPLDALAGFSEPTRAWFAGAFDGPTPAQCAAWRAISAGEHALVVAPTGSGKTLAAFLHSLDKLANTPSTGKVRVLYISPLKALAVDVEEAPADHCPANADPISNNCLRCGAFAAPVPSTMMPLRTTRSCS